MTNAKVPRLTGRMIVGALLVLVGLLFTLDNLGVLDAGRVFEFWPLILVAVGALKVLQPREDGQRALGVGLIAFGLFLQLQMLAVVDWSFGDIWPVLLLFLGGILIFRGIRRRRSPAASAASDLSELAFMGGVNRVIVSQDFRGGEVTAVMGGVEVDLRQASISEESAVIDVFALWGGIEIKVPQEWTVDVKGLPIMGGFENTTHSSVTDPALAQKLIVRGTAIMGGVEIKN